MGERGNGEVSIVPPPVEHISILGRPATLTRRLGDPEAENTAHARLDRLRMMAVEGRLRMDGLPKIGTFIAPPPQPQETTSDH